MIIHFYCADCFKLDTGTVCEPFVQIFLLAGTNGVPMTAQGAGELGRLDPKTGKTHTITLGQGSVPHGVIVGPALHGLKMVV